MLAMYGHPWNSVHGTSPQDDSGALTIDGDTWSKALVGVSGQQMAAGLQACIAEGAEFPPSAPRFRAMCLGVPSLPAVRLDTGKADAFTRLVWQNLDGYLYRQSSVERAERMLRDAYDVAREHVMRGGALPEIAGELEHDGKPEGPAIPQTREERLRKLEELGVLENAAALRSLYGSEGGQP